MLAVGTPSRADGRVDLDAVEASRAGGRGSGRGSVGAGARHAVVRTAGLTYHVLGCAVVDSPRESVCAC